VDLEAGAGFNDATVPRYGMTNAEKSDLPNQSWIKNEARSGYLGPVTERRNEIDVQSADSMTIYNSKKSIPPRIRHKSLASPAVNTQGQD